MTRLARLRRKLEALFPERHIYIRANGETKGLVLTPRRQMTAAAGAAALVLWTVVATTALLVNAVTLSASDRELAQTEAKYQRWIADRQARLNSAVAQLNASEGSIGVALASVEKRHAALAMLLTDVRGAPGAAGALAPVIKLASAPQDVAPLRRVELVRLRQEKLLDTADAFAKTLDGKVDYEIVGLLSLAVDSATRDAEAAGLKEAVVLLSPACASFDQYPNFEVRGKAFHDLVLALPGVAAL